MNRMVRLSNISTKHEKVKLVTMPIFDPTRLDDCRNALQSISFIGSSLYNRCLNSIDVNELPVLDLAKIQTIHQPKIMVNNNIVELDKVLSPPDSSSVTTRTKSRSFKDDLASVAISKPYNRVEKIVKPASPKASSNNLMPEDVKSKTKHLKTKSTSSSLSKFANLLKVEKSPVYVKDPSTFSMTIRSDSCRNLANKQMNTSDIKEKASPTIDPEVRTAKFAKLSLYSSSATSHASNYEYL